MNDEPLVLQPTADRPLLLGLLVDVSGSMIKSLIASPDGSQQTRIDSVRESLNGLVERAIVYCTAPSSADILPKLGIFAYGFGFGNPWSFLSGWSGPPVVDLLDLPGRRSSTLGVGELAGDWSAVQEYDRTLMRHMGGVTPMFKALTLARDRIAQERAARAWTDQPVLFVLSDGMPTDAEPAEILRLVDEIKASGVLVMTCLLAEEGLADRRRMYAEAEPHWPPAARLMFHCASPLGEDMPIADQLSQEFGWAVVPDARAFAIIDSSKSLAAFLASTLSRLKPTAGPAPNGQPEPKAGPGPSAEPATGGHQTPAVVIYGDVRNLQTGSHATHQEHAGLDVEGLGRLIRFLTSGVPQTELEPAQALEVLRHTKAIEGEIQQPEPDRHKIRAWLKKLGSILGKATQDSIAVAMNAAVQKTISGL
ncbi:hypothetical protein GCM10009839_91190 [Catenulispora yoronensis]|uniref:VWFA domain-containing protein n=2 Tax=Catenulispora yoronensis TaxID=450799 RepID=A0ABP5H6E9_9ACTN